MTMHSRSRSKGSFSIFSIDNFRSLSRAGSRAASRPYKANEADEFTRSPSSLSRCDPSAQLPPSPATLKLGSDATIRSASPFTDTISTPTKTSKSTPLSTPGSRLPSSSSEPKQSRPLSWILFRGTAHALKKRSMSVQLPKDSSSSTMARSVISAPILTSTSNAKVANAEGVHYGELTQKTFAKPQMSTTVEPDHNVTSAGPSTDEKEQFSDPSTTQGANIVSPPGRLHKLSVALRTKFRKHDLQKREEGNSLHNTISRRKAETVNLCKEKIKDITGSGLVPRKSIDHKHDKHTDDNPPLLKKLSQATFNLDDDNVSQYGSLSRSFNSALEKLDIAATTNMSFLRSRSSLLNIRKENIAPPGPIVPQQNDELDGQARGLQQYHFAPSKGGYVSAPAVARYPGGINGLMMHTDTMAFASPPGESQSSAADLKATITGTSDPSSEVDDDYKLEEAPIFSPSMGDLSQYGNTPKPKKEKTSTSTPTKRPTLRKSNSGLSLLGRASLLRRDENMPLKKSRSMNLNPFKKESHPSVSSLKDMPYKPATPSPLRNEARLVKGRNARSGRSPDEQAKRFGIIGLPSPNKN